MINQWSLLEKLEESIQIVDEQKRVLTKFLEDCNNGLNLVRYMLMSRRQKSDASITKLEYIALRLNFIVASDPKDLGKDFRDKDLGKNFRDHIMTTLETDFEEMIGISLQLWLIAVIYLLVNVAGWNAYFWICFYPFTILVIITIKLEFMIMQLVEEIAKRHTQKGKEYSENGAKTTFFEISDSHFWLGSSHLVGNLIHVVLFVNSLELAFFFFILFQYGFHSCIMGKVRFVVPRIVIGVFVQLMCIYRTIPLYAILKSQMHLKEQQSDKQKERYPAHKEKKRRCPDIEKIKMLLKKNQSDEHIKECLDSLEEIELQLKKNEMDEEEEMWIVTWISKWIDKGKKPSLTEGAKSIEMTGMGSKEVTVGDEITQADDNEAQIDNTPSPRWNIGEDIV